MLAKEHGERIDRRCPLAGFVVNIEQVDFTTGAAIVLHETLRFIQIDIGMGLVQKS